MNTLNRSNTGFIASRACLVLSLILSIGLWSPTMAQSFPETVPLPDGFQPEGITLGTGHKAYVGSLAGGSIYAVDLRTGAGSTLITGMPGSLFAVGLDFDARSGYLFVAGGLTGDGRVYDSETGQMILRLTLGPAWASWINDVVVTRDAAYFTNSFAPFIYKVPLDSEGEPTGAVYPLMLGGDWQQFTNPAPPPVPLEETFINANGIVATPNNRTLIVVNYVSGLLYTVDPDTGYATEIDLELGGASLQTGDGLVLRGKTLYVVQNVANAIAVLEMSPDFSSGMLTGYLEDSDLKTPSTADSFGPWLYAVNARFFKCFPGPCPTLEYDVVRVDQ